MEHPLNAVRAPFPAHSNASLPCKHSLISLERAGKKKISALYCVFSLGWDIKESACLLQYPVLINYFVLRP